MAPPVTIAESDQSGALSYRFYATCTTKYGPRECGDIVVTRVTRPIGGWVAWKVYTVHVDAEHRRLGIATKLYEAAAREACRRRGRLASTNRAQGAHSNDFWAKQIAKGRARSVRQRHGQPPAYILKDCPVATLTGVRQR